MDTRAPLPFTARQIAKALGGEASGNSVTAPGPRHSREDRSLSITLDPKAPDGFVCYSHAGDDWQTCRDYVADRLGLPKWEPSHKRAAGSPVFHDPQPRDPTKSDRPPPLREPDAPKPFSDRGLLRDGYRLAATYPYCDPDGVVLYEVLRYEHPSKKKTFLARHLVGSRWCAGAGERRVLYRSGDRAKFDHRFAFVTEGEKDADRLVSLGQLAVTVAFGKWSEEAVQDLAGYACMVLEDNDEAGRKKALQSCEALAQVAESVRVVRLPGLAQGEDVSDWLDAGHTVDDLVRVTSEVAIDPQAEAPGTPKISATPFVFVDPTKIPPRAWIYGKHYIRRFISTTVAPGGVGKSSLGIVESLAICTGRDLLGVQPDEQVRVWLWNGEDPMEELQRRIVAAMEHHRVDRSEVEGQLFVDTGRQTKICIAEQTKAGVTIQHPVVDAVIETIKVNDIGLIIIDPFVSSHRVSENDNNAIEMVAAEWAAIAEVTGCAVELVHHVRKTGGNEVGVEDGRGASSLLAKARSARALNPMTEDQAEKACIENRRAYFCAGNGKANLHLAIDKADWFKMWSVELGNEAEGRHGDSVGVATAWKWPDPLAAVTTSDLLAAQRAVHASGPWRENYQAKNWVGRPIAEVLHLDPDNKGHVRQIVAMLKIWIENGMFVRVPGKDEKRMDRIFVEVGNWATD